MKKYTNMVLAVFLLLPAAAFAAAAPFAGIKELIEAIGSVVDVSFAVVVGLALLAFLWGLAKFIFHVAGDEKAIADGKRIMKWGLVALFVMVSVWGIVRFMQRQLNLPSSRPPTIWI